MHEAAPQTACRAVSQNFTTLAEAQALLERLDQRYAARDTIRWAIELVESGEMIGSVGLLRFDFEHRHAERRISARPPETRFRRGGHETRLPARQGALPQLPVVQSA
jgi:RimJ/RimL family protein N-acetyltransferase